MSAEAEVLAVEMRETVAWLEVRAAAWDRLATLDRARAVSKADLAEMARLEAARIRGRAKLIEMQMG